jgi:hypothetical protein
MYYPSHTINMAQPETHQYVQSLNKRRKRQRMYGWGLLIFGILTYIDGAAGISLPPIWLTGILAFLIGTPIIILGIALLLLSYTLPVREALLFASIQGGKVTAPSLSMGLDITLEASEAILDHLSKKGYAQVSTEDMEEGTVVYKISGIQKF